MAGAERRERLREIARVRQHPGDEGRRRWFACPSADLFVWEGEHGAVLRFELCYGKPRAEHALAWDPARGLRHAGVDDGESSAVHNRTPIMVPDGLFDTRSIALEFERVGAAVTPRLYRFVLGRLLGDS